MPVPGLLAREDQLGAGIGVLRVQYLADQDLRLGAPSPRSAYFPIK